ncbi:hypothetical protein PTH_2732 [Pelotomaculum thermopropionicum SI]|uniref:Glycogen debranching enzyme C-terminal domain-containing protein n=1 Tax=Pelotomaculum thermopropionicum (strain DSM 13744 / JCM 10971 / SI) TaxID=370438 RepID=A5CYL0_PELTS|nr:hypothetical protein PTH_2732 [Pelotomaculum thermopropionicum SI]
MYCFGKNDWRTLEQGVQKEWPPFRDHLRDHGVGYISEIFDGDEPAAPRGCIAQAWGVAEVLRAYVEDVLEIRPPAQAVVEGLTG